MTREIKFRAWNEKLGMIYKSHLDQYDNSFEYNDMFLLDLEGRFWLDLNTSIDRSIDYDSLNQLEYELMQFTGLKDKNGKEIYEGDIVDLLHPCWSNISEVKYFENEACFGLESLEKINKGSRKSFLHIFQEPYLKLKVLGNIYENKDLLKNT